jgi:hypothetical protein
MVEELYVMTAEKKQYLSPGRLVGRILGQVGIAGSKELAAWRKPEKDLRRLLQHDYASGLCRNLGHRELRRLIAAAHKVWPRLNVEPIASMSTRKLGELALNLQLHFRAEPCPGAEGMALRGFYVGKAEAMLKRPLIYVNTAYHPLAISTTFCHELGHHLTAQALKPASPSVVFYFDADYSSHLDEPLELSADALVSLAGYPKPLARSIFSSDSTLGRVARAEGLTEDVICSVRDHLKQCYGFDFMTMSSTQRMRYLSGMIHYAKLRWAMLAEYNI